MPNPPLWLHVRGSRGTCQECTGYGGPEKYGATYCLRPEDSGKRISNMPESGCYKFVRRDEKAQPKAS